MSDSNENDRYAFVIHTESMKPAGRNTHIAKVTRMVDLKLNVDIQYHEEAWGENECEARTKLQDRVEKWIAKQL